MKVSKTRRYRSASAGSPPPKALTQLSKAAGVRFPRRSASAGRLGVSILPVSKVSWPSDMDGSVHLRFRDWLLQKLLSHQIVSINVPDERIEKLAKRMGVQPDLVFEARALYRIDRAKHGRGTLRRRLGQWDVWVPHPIWKAWEEECAFRGVEPPVLLRSLVAEYLSGTREPITVLAYWFWKGKRYGVGHGGKDAHHAKAQFPYGAWRVLQRRAKRSGVTGSGIIRALILETL